MRVFLRFFFSPSAPPEGADLDAVFFASFSALAGALDAVDAGGFPAVDAGLGAMAKGQSWVGGLRGRDVAVGGKDGKRRKRRAAGLYTDATRLFSFVHGRGPLLMRINKSRLALARDRPAVYISGARDDRCFSSTSISPVALNTTFSTLPTHPHNTHHNVWQSRRKGRQGWWQGWRGRLWQGAVPLVQGWCVASTQVA